MRRRFPQPTRPDLMRSCLHSIGNRLAPPHLLRPGCCLVDPRRIAIASRGLAFGVGC